MSKKFWIVINDLCKPQSSAKLQTLDEARMVAATFAKHRYWETYYIMECVERVKAQAPVVDSVEISE